MFRVPCVCEVTIECRILGFDITEQEIPVVFKLYNMQYYTFVSTNWYSNTKTKPRLDQFSLIEQSSMNVLIALLESMCVVSNQVLKALDLLCRYAERINYLMVNSFGLAVCLSIFSYY